MCTILSKNEYVQFIIYYVETLWVCVIVVIFIAPVHMKRLLVCYILNSMLYGWIQIQFYKISKVFLKNDNSIVGGGVI